MLAAHLVASILLVATALLALRCAINIWLPIFTVYLIVPVLSGVGYLMHAGHNWDGWWIMVPLVSEFAAVLEAVYMCLRFVTLRQRRYAVCIGAVFASAMCGLLILTGGKPYPGDSSAHWWSGAILHLFEVSAMIGSCGYVAVIFRGRWSRSAWRFPAHAGLLILWLGSNLLAHAVQAPEGSDEWISASVTRMIAHLACVAAWAALVPPAYETRSVVPRSPRGTPAARP